jgi:hypothetical protein
MGRGMGRRAVEGVARRETGMGMGGRGRGRAKETLRWRFPVLRHLSSLVRFYR